MSLHLKLAICICFLLSCSRNQAIRYINDLEQANIKGHVAKILTKTYQIKGSNQKDILESETIEIFDELGYTITDTSREIIGGHEIVNFLKYNKNGSLSSISTFENGMIRSKMFLTYANGSCVSIKIYDSTNILESYYSCIVQTRYGLLSSMNSYNAMGKLTMTYANKYDGIYQVGAIAKDSSGVSKSEITIHLNNNKDPLYILEVTYDKDSMTHNKMSYKYIEWDSVGNWTRQIMYDDNGKATKTVQRNVTYR